MIIECREDTETHEALKLLISILSWLLNILHGNIRDFTFHLKILMHGTKINTILFSRKKKKLMNIKNHIYQEEMQMMTHNQNTSMPLRG